MKSLLARHHPLSILPQQRELLAERDEIEPFERRMSQIGLSPLLATGIGVFQVNVGKMCNQTCRHCHVDAGPDRTEIMTRETMELCLAALRRIDARIVDITGGAPELNPHFRWLVEQVRGLGRQVIDRCNLTILTLPGFADLPDFLAHHRVEITASLPYYLEHQTDAQRGEHVFERSIQALKRLNEVGYGRPDSGLILNLVFNPVGAYLPPKQASIEADYKRELNRRHGIVFNALYTITNMPINRFLEYLIESGNYAPYMHKLTAAFNPDAAGAVMCRTTLSIGWDGRLYDCDFNQMLDVGISGAGPAHIRDFDPESLASRRIRTGNYCYGCTAGSGSSCTGTVA